MPSPRPAGARSIETGADWIRLVAAVAIVYAVFEAAARGLGSGYGQWGVAIAVLVVATTLLAERFIVGARRSRVRSGFGAPAARGLVAVAAASTALVLVVPIHAWLRGADVTVHPDALVLSVGLFAQSGVAEETLFRGFAYARLRDGRSWGHAAALSIVPFALVHLALFLTLPAPVVVASVALAAAISFPLARLYDLGGHTIWAPALLHFVVQAVPKLVVFGEGELMTFAFVWMAAAASIPILVVTWMARR